MLSQNQLKQLFQDKQTNHNQLSSGTFLFDRVPEFGAAEQITYPLMGVTVNPVVLDGNIHTSSFAFVFLDLVHQDNRNMDVLMSEMQKVALEIFSQIRYDLQVYYNCTINENITLEPLQSVYDDDVSGWGFELSVVQHYDRSTCTTPASGGTSGTVTILDQNGNVVAYLNPNTTYTVTNTMDTAENYTVTGTTQTILQTPVFIYGVFLNGQRLTVTTDYTVAGTTITFINALASDSVTVVYSY